MGAPVHLVAETPSEPIDSVEQLIDYLAQGGKPAAQWRVGTEHEMIGVYATGPEAGAAPPYEGERGIGAVFQAFQERGWTPIREADSVIALTCHRAQVTFEPGGQLEHALIPLRHGDDIARAMARNVAQVAEVSERLGLAWLSIGFRPFGRLDDVPWMPKRRYSIMREYLPTRGALAHEMMKRTATVQVNLDFGDADDALAKMRCLSSVTSLLTALYANSPVVDEQLTDLQSYRSLVWLDTDPDRCGLLPFVFEDGDVFRAYTEWALDVPMFFVHRGGYRPAGSRTFRRFLREGFEGERATLDDWALHLSTLFPEVRMKRYLEVRGCDAGSFEMIASLAVLCDGLLYDQEACRAATELTAGLEFAERLELGRAVAERGLHARVGQRDVTVRELARQMIDIAADGLSRRDRTELPYLGPLRAVVEEGRTQADKVADIWRRHAGDTERLIRELAYPGLGRPPV
jgi:glutamate--cysteine ligase